MDQVELLKQQSDLWRTRKALGRLLIWEGGGEGKKIRLINKCRKTSKTQLISLLV